MTGQLLAVAGDEKQCVVGAGAEHEHPQDARALPVDGQPPVLGREIDQTGGGLVGDGDRQERDQPQQGAPVDDQQDDRDNSRGDEQQRGLHPAEHVKGVGQQAGRSGDRRLEPRWCRVPDDPPNFLDLVGELHDVSVLGEADGQEQGVPLRGGDGHADRTLGESLEPVAERLNHRPVSRCQLGVTHEGDDRRYGVPARQKLLGLEQPGGFGL